MENESINRQPGINEAIARIQIIIAEVSAMGANDSEFHDFQMIMDRLQSGTLTPTEAITQAEAIRGSKMDYH
jgi:hypothetical protein